METYCRNIQVGIAGTMFQQAGEYLQANLLTLSESALVQFAAVGPASFETR